MNALRHLRWVALAEGVSFLLLLFIAMPLKYAYGQPLAVRVVGMAHGLLFLVFIVALIRATFEREWSLTKSTLAFVSSLVPFGTFALDRVIAKELAATSTQPST